MGIQVRLASSRMLYLAYLLSDITLKITPISMHFVPIDRPKDSFLRRSISLLSLLLSFTTQRRSSSVTTFPFSTTSTKASSSFASLKGLNKRRT